MLLTDIQSQLPEALYALLQQQITELRPAQEKAIKAGLLERKNQLICTPTASGKTLIGVLALLNSILTGKGKGIYLVPLRALAAEKYKEFQKLYGGKIKIALSLGNTDDEEPHLARYDLIFCTAEKLDALLRHHTPWISSVSTLVIDEIHLLHDLHRGPTLEVLITLLRTLIPHLHLVGLSATIGNPEDLASWLDAVLIQDDWRPVPLHQGIYHQEVIDFLE